MNTHKLLGLTASILAVSISGYGQSDPAPAPVAATDKQQVVVTHGKDTLSVDFPDEEIRNVLRNVADLFELNLVVPDTLQGKTSIKLRDVTWRQIYEVVLRPAGYTYIEEGNIIKVVTAESLNMEPVTTEVFILNYAKAAEVKPTVDSLVDGKAGGKIVVDARSNALVVTERPSAIQKIRPIIQNLDRATEQVMIESKFIEVTTNNADTVGIDWPVAQTVTASFPKAVGTNSIREFTQGVFSQGSLAVTLNALNSKGRVKLVSNPTVVTINNTEALINVGLDYPIPNYTYNQEQGKFEVSGFVFKPIGINMKVLPQVNSAGYIKLTVRPELSELNGNAPFQGASIPIIKTKKTETQVTLKDGYTLGIGGLMSSSDNSDKSKVPLLGSIPGLGRLFGSTSNSKSQTNLLIFITARTLRPDGASAGDIFDPRMIRDSGITREELPGYRDGSDPFAQPVPAAKK